MRTPSELQRDLVLVGGGHSHALALRMLAMNPVAGLRITLVSPDSHTPYSGMLPGLIAGHYTFEQVHIDLSRLCQWAGVRFIPAEVTAIDPLRKQLSLHDRPPIDYDVASIDIGSRPELDSVPGADEHALPVKPIAQLWRRWQNLEAQLQAPGTGALRIAVVGGGAGGVELALAIAFRLRDTDASVELFCADNRILEGYNGRSRAGVMKALQESGIGLRLGARVSAVQASKLALENGDVCGFDELFWCTRAAAAPFIATSGLANDERGFLAVRDTLQVLDDDYVFAAGDIATQVNHPRPKAGVYAVRQAPVLAYNLRAFMLGHSLRAHKPQERFLSLLSLGDRAATANRSLFSATGRWVWRWKDRIDRTFMDRFTELPNAMQSVPADSLSPREQEEQMACGGCGAKVGADVLANALAWLGEEFPAQCVGGGDDATAIPAPAGQAVVQSIDVLRSIVPDPLQMGRIAANHALSDLYASGARPVSALAAVTLPFASRILLERDLRQLLYGALQVFREEDCQLRGGHSMQGAELSIGFTVNGVPIVDDGTLLNKTGAAPGDQLVLCKALGIGTLFAAHMQLAADGRDITAAVGSMIQGNGAAAALAVSHGASACTDITGFGLLGHLLEMLGSQRGARIHLDSLPILAGALERVRAGIVSTMHQANMASAEGALHRGVSVDEGRLQMVFDPQTSGGLLVALPASEAPGLVAALQSAGYVSATVIGEITDRTGAGTPPVEVF